jgi:transcriptional regulator with XRE-family HTH domain
MDREFEQMRRALAANVQRLRKSKSLTQEELAFEAEVDRTYVSQIERRLKNPSLLILHKLAKALDSNVIALLQA